jgi:hypothetical protein
MGDEEITAGGLKAADGWMNKKSNSIVTKNGILFVFRNIYVTFVVFN